MNIITKNHILYGSVRFMKDYDGIFKPLAGDVLDITGNNTIEKYNRDSLLEKREFFRLINACKDNIDLFKDWLNNNYYRLNKDNKSVTTFKNESEILNIITLDDYVELDIHPFSCNNMYEANKNKLETTSRYNSWWNNVPTDNLIRFKDVDFNRPVFVAYHFKYLPSYDIENLLKATSDKICDFLATDDSNFNSFRITGEHVKKYNDGKIYVFICNIEESI